MDSSRSSPTNSDEDIIPDTNEYIADEFSHLPSFRTPQSSKNTLKSPSTSNISAVKTKLGKRFAFTIEKDINLLNSALNINPFQLGKEKWADVCTDLRNQYKYDLKERTAKERIEALLKKYEKEELSKRTGTEEQRTERGNLLKEIKTLIEQESNPVNELFDGESDIELGPDATKEKCKQDRADKKKANDDRESLLNKHYSDTPPEPNSFRVKRTKAAQEEDLIITKHKHDMTMEEKRFKLDEEVQRAKIFQEDRRLDIEFIREKRLATEAEERNELMKTLCKSIEFMQQFAKST